MGKPKLTLFLDVISPFAYIAFYVTKNSKVFKDCDVTYVPIFLGGVFKAVGNRAPLEVKNKDKWINTERQRWQKYFTIPMSENTPDPFPQPTLNTQRALCYIELNHPEKLSSSFAELYQAFWVEGKTIGKAEVIQPALAKVFGEEAAKKIVEQMGSPEAKKRLSENSEKAMEKGAFGLPWWVATNADGEEETFWGVDHMGQVVDHLGLKRGDEPGLRAML